MRDLNNILLLYSLRVAFTPLEHFSSTADGDYYELKTILKQHVSRLENRLHWSSEDGWTRPDAASSRQAACCSPLANRDCTDSEGLSTRPASSPISIARTLLRTLERGSEIPDGSPALEKLREALAEIVTELGPVKKGPKFELQTGALNSRRAG